MSIVLSFDDSYKREVGLTGIFLECIPNWELNAIVAGSENMAWGRKSAKRRRDGIPTAVWMKIPFVRAAGLFLVCRRADERFFSTCCAYFSMGLAHSRNEMKC